MKVKVKATFMAGLFLAFGGVILRVSALDFVQDDTAPVANRTTREFWQQTWIDLGNMALAGGLAIIILAFHHWNKNTGGHEQSTRWNESD